MTQTKAEEHLKQVARLVEVAEAADARSAASLYRQAADLLEERTNHEPALPERQGPPCGSRVRG
jgi:hypothetical protein